MGPGPAARKGGNLSVEGPGLQERRGTTAQRDQGGSSLAPPTPTASSQSSGHGLARKLRPSRQTWKRMPGPSPILAGLVREIGGGGVGESWGDHCLPGWGKRGWEEDGSWVPCCDGAGAW